MVRKDKEKMQKRRRKEIENVQKSHGKDPVKTLKVMVKSQKSYQKTRHMYMIDTKTYTKRY